MLRVDRGNWLFSQLDSPTLSDAQILERADLQECIFNSSTEFFTEIGESLFVVGKEVVPSESVQDRIDLLALDAEGTAVIVELKRGSDKLQMLQAVSYAGMISRWGADDFRRLISDDEWEALTDFLNVDVDDVNRGQRILLVAEGYDYALLAGAEWLSDQHGVDIRCASLTLATDPETGAEYIACANVFPSPTLIDQAKPRNRSPRNSRRAKWANWDEALAAIQNEELREFARSEVEVGREDYLRRRGFHYRLDGRRRWTLQCRGKSAYVWQRGRFDDDERYWTELLGESASVKAVRSGSALSFSLSNAPQLSDFREAVTQLLEDREWFDDIPVQSEEEV
jgi:hypothetical protein